MGVLENREKLHLEEQNRRDWGFAWEEGMEWNERIFLEYSSLLLVWEFKWERIEWVGGNTHYSLFPKNLKFSFPMKLRGMWGNEVRFNDFFTKTPKMLLYIQPFILK